MSQTISSLVQWAASRRSEFFIRQKSNREWEAGWGRAGEEMTVRAVDALSTLKALYAAKFS